MTTNAERRFALRRFADDFERGAYWDAHEHLEALWREERVPAWQALIQLAAVFVLLESGRHDGARSVLARAQSKISDAPAMLHGVDVRWVRGQLDGLSRALESAPVHDARVLAEGFEGLHARLGVAAD